MRLAPLLLVMLLLSGSLAACQGCRTPSPQSENDAAPSAPSIRLYLVTSFAGALEPCGCSKDQLGGVDHLAAFIRGQQQAAPNALVLGAGPLLYIDPRLKGEHATQDRWKAGAIAEAMKDVELAAWAPGFNDWAGGAEALKQNAATASAVALGVGVSGLQGQQIFERGGLKIGVFGLSDPRDRLGKYPEGVTAAGADAALVQAKEQVAALQAKGAQLIVGLAAMQRGSALRVADGVTGIHVLVVGKASSEGHGNTEQPPPELINDTLVVATANHGQTVSLVDVYVRGDAGSKPLPKLADAGGVAKAAEVADVSRQIRELENRINGWEKGGTVDPKDLQARKADLAVLQKKRDKLQTEQPAPKGHFFRYRVAEVREGLGKDEAVAARMLAFYKRVNEHNKKAFADLKPLPVAEGEASYVGVEACSDCHMEEREVWDKTAHARAYATLEKDFKEYNLECVGCHVTGYGKPGGSTVTFNDKLRDVQCEDCHGPGSLHLKDPENKALITLAPDPRSCVERCHHPPHVEGFDATAKMGLVLGPGHGE